jgi:hypothetical protein
MMEPDKRYQLWLRQRAGAPVPEDFADRVMDLIQKQGGPIPQGPALKRLFLILVSSRLSKAGVCTLAFLACVFRMLSVLALFLPG